MSHGEAAWPLLPVAEDYFFALRIILYLPLAHSLNDPFSYFADVAGPILLPDLPTPSS